MEATTEVTQALPETPHPSSVADRTGSDIDRHRTLEDIRTDPQGAFAT
jgi:hypothetical protein